MNMKDLLKKYFNYEQGNDYELSQKGNVTIIAPKETFLEEGFSDNRNRIQDMLDNEGLLAVVGWAEDTPSEFLFAEDECLMVETLEVSDLLSSRLKLKESINNELSSSTTFIIIESLLGDTMDLLIGSEDNGSVTIETLSNCMKDLGLTFDSIDGEIEEDYFEVSVRGVKFEK